ncbi:MAG: S9 family peptidase [Solirubrobacteraceae bacterium]
MNAQINKSSTTEKENLTTAAPVAKKIAKEITTHNDTRIDNYYWLNDKENKEVISYLNEENTYTKTVLLETEKFQEKLFLEMKSRIKEDDQSVPYKLNGYWYITKYKKGNEYAIHTRRKETIKAKEEILFDVNKMAEGFKYYTLGGISISFNNEIAAFSVDTVSRRQYTIQFKDLITGEILKDKIENTTGGCVWANDNKTIFYTKKDKTLRAAYIYKHTLGTNEKEDQLVYEEKDETFGCGVFKSKSKEYIMIASSSTNSDEYRFIPANEPNAKWKVIQPREKDLEYEVAHYKDHFYIRTNKDKATNFKIMKTSVLKTEKENWTDLVPHRKEIYLEDFEIFSNYLVLEERKNGLIEIKITRWENEAVNFIEFKEETYVASIGLNPDFDSNTLRYSYSSLTTPSSTLEYDMEKHTSKTLKQQEVLDSSFKPKNYISERLWANARDGKKVAISIVRHKDTKLSKDTPLLQYGYGSYGITVDPSFSSTRLSLLNRGFIFAIAHIRGGEYLGREWYEEGKLLKKKNTFFDFIDASKFLIENNYTSSNHLYAMGGSAGGLLMGAIINMEPELYNGIVASVPFVDVVTTMLDEEIPLTTGEFDEWGNPKEKVYYDYMKSYSPYDNVEKKAYPNILITTGLHDSQVQYWEPAKWTAKLRELKTNNKLLLLHTNMDTGHGGASGRFESLKEIAMEYAFLFLIEEIKK